MSGRLARAAADVFSRPALYWAIAAAFWLRVAILTVLTPTRNDAEGMWEGAHAYLINPSHMYDAAARYIAQFHIIAPPGGLNAYVSPPPLAALTAPVALLPKSIAVQVWAGIDTAALLLALWLLYRLLASRHPLARPAFWLVAAYFPPLFSDVVAFKYHARRNSATILHRRRSRAPRRDVPRGGCGRVSALGASCDGPTRRRS